MYTKSTYLHKSIYVTIFSKTRRSCWRVKWPGFLPPVRFSSLPLDAVTSRVAPNLGAGRGFYHSGYICTESVPLRAAARACSDYWDPQTDACTPYILKVCIRCACADEFSDRTSENIVFHSTNINVLSEIYRKRKIWVTSLTVPLLRHLGAEAYTAHGQYCRKLVFV